MTPQEELELIEIELELRRRSGPATIARPKEAGAGRSALAGAVMGPAKTVAGMADTLQHAPNPNPLMRAGRVLGERLFGKQEPLTPKVDALRDILAGGKSNNLASSAAEGATGGLLFPGGKVANIVSGAASSSVAHTGNEQGWHPAITLGLATAAGVGPASLIEGSQAVRGRAPFLAAGRAKDALQRSAPEGLREAEKFQKWAADRGFFLLPSQSTGKATPGLLDLETSIFQSKSPTVQALREKIFGQYGQADKLARSTVGELPGRILPEDEAAGKVVRAAQGVREGQKQVGNIASKDFYEAGKATQVTPTAASLGGVRKQLVDARVGSTSGDVRSGIGYLEHLLDDLFKVKGKNILPADLVDVHKRFTEWLDAPNAKGTILPDTAKKELRELSERTVRKLGEDIAPALREGREIAARFKADYDYDPFDALTKEGQSTATKTALATLLHKPRVAIEIADGVKAPQFDPATGKRIGEATLGANVEAPSDALKTAADVKRREAFRLVQGTENPQAPGLLAQSLAPDEVLRKELAEAVARLGGDGKRLGENLDLLTALGRPTNARGSQIDNTSISPVQAAQASGLGGALQVNQARASIFRAIINRMSDAAVAEALQRPDSVAALQLIAGAQAMTPRAALAAVLTANAQMQE